MSCIKTDAISLTAQDLALIGSGGELTIPHSCNVSGVTNDASCPNEFEKVRTGESCTTNTIDDGSDFDWTGLGLCGSPFGKCIGKCEIAGKRTACRRRSGGAGYQADPLVCCLTQGTRIINGKTCDPGYFDGSKCEPYLINYCTSADRKPWENEKCNKLMNKDIALKHQFMNAYCSVGDRIFNDTDCKNWIISNPDNATVKSVVLNKCNNTNLNKEPCQTFIKDRAKYSSEFDALMTSYCKGPNKNKQLCACINSADNYAIDKDYEEYCQANPDVKGCNCLSLAFDVEGTIPNKPICLDPKCATPEKCNDGVVPFRTYDMNGTTCSYVQCKLIIDLMNTTQVGDTNEINIDQALNCGVSPDAIASYKKKVNDPNGLLEPPKPSSNIIYVLFIILVLAIVSVLLYKFTFFKKGNQKQVLNDETKNKF